LLWMALLAITGGATSLCFLMYFRKRTRVDPPRSLMPPEFAGGPVRLLKPPTAALGAPAPSPASLETHKHAGEGAGAPSGSSAPGETQTAPPPTNAERGMRNAEHLAQAAPNTPAGTPALPVEQAAPRQEQT
jgi:hypothetical protein